MTTYQKAKERLLSLQIKLESLKPALDCVDEVSAMFPELKCSPYNGDNYAAINIQDVKDLKQVVPLLAAIIARGFHAIEQRDNAEYNHRCYEFGRTKWNKEVTVFASLAREGASCQFKQVGVKEQPVYELVCT